MKGLLAGMLISSGLSTGLLKAAQLRSRVRELEIFQRAILDMKNSAAYTLGDLSTILVLCRENPFLALVSETENPLYGWETVSRQFFTYPEDGILATDFISGFGKTDLAGLLSYIALYETRIEAALENARQIALSRCRLYTVLGLFTGTAAALVLC